MNESKKGEVLGAMSTAMDQTRRASKAFEDFWQDGTRLLTANDIARVETWLGAMGDTLLEMSILKERFRQILADRAKLEEIPVASA